MKISNENRALIKKAIVEAELKTSGEIVPVILSKSDFYPAAHFRLALFFAFFLAVLTYNFYDFDDSVVLIWVQIPGMILGYLLAYIPFLKRLATTDAEMKEEVFQRALEVFHQSNVSKTKDRTGIMIYVSLLERRVEVMADNGIASVVKENYWDEIVSDLISQIKTGKIIDGMAAAVTHCGAELIANFPIATDDKNEITDELITDL